MSSNGHTSPQGHPIYQKEKGFIWYLWPGASRTYTTIKQTIYHPKGRPIHESSSLWTHEGTHTDQQLQVGLYKYIFLYLFCLPIFYNPWRYKWEYEAYKATNTPEWIIKEKLRSGLYGWLKH